MIFERLFPALSEIAALQRRQNVRQRDLADLIAFRNPELIDQFPGCFSELKQPKISLSGLLRAARAEFDALSEEGLDLDHRELFFNGDVDCSLPTLTWTEDERIPKRILSQMRTRTIRDALLVRFRRSEYLVAHTNWPGETLDTWVPSDHDFLFLCLVPTKGIDFSR